MQKSYEYGAMNHLCILVHCGRVYQIKYYDFEKRECVVLERGTNKYGFFCLLKTFMRDQADIKPAQFMDLYIGLTDDPEAKELADEIYRTRINKDKYPLDTIKALANDIPKKKIGANATFGDDAWNYILVKDGIVTMIEQGSIYAGRCVYRSDTDFYNTLYYTLESLADKEPTDFMSFYSMVEDSDDVAFGIAEKIRKNKIAETHSIFDI